MDDYFFYCQQIMASKIAYWAINYMNYFELTIKPIQQTDRQLFECWKLLSFFTPVRKSAEKSNLVSMNI